MEQSSSSITPLRRAAHIGHVHNRAARLAVRDIQQHLGTWQQTVARLRALRFHDGSNSGVSAVAEEMLPLVTADKLNLEARLDVLDSAVATHSLLRDVLRALKRLEADLHQLTGH